MRACLTLLSLALPAAAFAQGKSKITEFLPGTPGERACYARAYDAKHLREHPKQRVTQMTVFLRVAGIDDTGDWVLDPKQKYGRLSYQFAMSVKRRGEKQMTTNGYCPEESRETFCARECDGGGVTLEKSAEAMLIRLDQFGIRMDGCDEEKSKWFKGGADDKLFRLEKVSLEQCKALEKDELGP